jgi:molybdenum cofactor cytidylyltransferase
MNGLKPLRNVGLLLAAGAGTRFGGAYAGAKLDQMIDGVAVGVRSFEKLARACDATVVVVRNAQSLLALHARERGARIIVNEAPERGLGHSMALGAIAILAKYDEAQYIWTTMADMPFIENNTFDLFRPAFLRQDVDSLTGIYQPIFAAPANASARASAQHGKPGHPVIFGRAHWDALAVLDGDMGARSIITGHRDCLTQIETSDEGIWRDIDTPDDLMQ